MTTVASEDMARLLTALRDDYGGSVEALLTAARKGATASRRRRGPDPVALRTASEVLDVLRLKVLSREEARRLLGLRPARTSTRSRTIAGRSGGDPIGVLADWMPSA